MKTVICINLKRGLPSSVRIEKNGKRYEHRATTTQRENCSVGWLIWSLKKNGQVLSDVYGVVTPEKFGKKSSLFLVFSENPAPGFDARITENDLREILLNASWRVKTQIDTEELVDVVSLDSRKSPATIEWIVGSDLEFRRIEDMIFSLAQQGKYQEAFCLAEGMGFKNAPEKVVEGLVSMGSSDFPNTGRV